jgi:hypothetical protein
MERGFVSAGFCCWTVVVTAGLKTGLLWSLYAALKARLFRGAACEGGAGWRWPPSFGAEAVQARSEEWNFIRARPYILIMSPSGVVCAKAH